MQVFRDLLIDLRIILSFSCRISDGAWQMANQDFFYLILKDSSFSSCFLFNKRQASLSRLASSSSLVPGNAGLLTRMDARGGGPPTGTVQCAQWVACPRYTKERGGGGYSGRALPRAARPVGRQPAPRAGSQPNTSQGLVGLVLCSQQKRQEQLTKCGAPPDYGRQR